MGLGKVNVVGRMVKKEESPNFLILSLYDLVKGSHREHAVKSCGAWDFSLSEGQKDPLCQKDSAFIGW